MANFQTHLNVGILMSAGTVLALHLGGLAGSAQIPLLFALGVAGSLVPDIDSTHSVPSHALFNVLGAALAFAVTLPLGGRFAPWVMLGLWCLVFVAVRYGVLRLFGWLTVHRGIWHSWLAAATAATATADLAYWLGGQRPEAAWLVGLMVGVGYLTHLVLDEIYSVNLFNVRINRSFGSALKPFSLRYPLGTFLMAVGLAGLILLAPPPDSLIARLGWDPQTAWAELEAALTSGMRWARSEWAGWWNWLGPRLTALVSG
ncbi:metal-dependent hydrolase [Caldichromatium japonicum]|uniref:Metal-dependent hydrolase n=1 Tax=Caldichromatium japonicum TaxID=2699430 RepID=A0A6G7VD70_9GAMM|nr:metal-dependent hydrolase [Caldichromatium japonicum]QIK37850.1 metal-dependent hydrolase [Caldichromatium japonicum]